MVGVKIFYDTIVLIIMVSNAAFAFATLTYIVRYFRSFRKSIIDRDIARSVEVIADSYSFGEYVYDTAKCPTCGHEYEVEFDNHDRYCRDCGQALDWSEIH